MTCLLVFLQGYVRRLWYEYDGPPKSSKNFRRLKFFFLGKEIPTVPKPPHDNNICYHFKVISLQILLPTLSLL